MGQEQFLKHCWQDIKCLVLKDSKSVSLENTYMKVERFAVCAC